LNASLVLLVACISIGTLAEPWVRWNELVCCKAESTATSREGPSHHAGWVHSTWSRRSKLDGQCRTNLPHDALQCDIHNGLVPWNITEIIFQVIRNTDPENEHHDYRERVSIGSLQTETVNIKLGMQLPADTRLTFRNGKSITTDHWSWLIVGAKGTPVGN
jgi:hypothetical protein